MDGIHNTTEVDISPFSIEEIDEHIKFLCQKNDIELTYVVNLLTDLNAMGVILIPVGISSDDRIYSHPRYLNALEECEINPDEVLVDFAEFRNRLADTLVLGDEGVFGIALSARHRCIGYQVTRYGGKTFVGSGRDFLETMLHESISRFMFDRQKINISIAPMTTKHGWYSRMLSRKLPQRQTMFFTGTKMTYKKSDDYNRLSYLYPRRTVIERLLAVRIVLARRDGDDEVMPSHVEPKGGLHVSHGSAYGSDATYNVNPLDPLTINTGAENVAISAARFREASEALATYISASTSNFSIDFGNDNT